METNEQHNQSELDYLLGRANFCLSSLETILHTLNKNFPVDGCKWAVWENQVDCVRFEDLEWDEFEEPNEPKCSKGPFFDEQDQEFYLRQ